MESINNVDDYSYTSYYADILFDDLKIGSATTFIYEYKSKAYLVTNWHVVTGRDAFTNTILDKNYASIPNKLKLQFFYKHNEELDYKAYIVSLYDKNDEPLWYEHELDNKRIDIAIIPMVLGEEIVVYPVNTTEEPFNEETMPEVREDVFVLGYPFGFDGGGGLPIWKRASIASEPSVKINGLPIIYVDTASRPGMSGAPVVYKERRTAVLINEEKRYFSRYKTKFVGIYSGRTGAMDNYDVQLGIVWKAELIEMIIDQNETH